MNTNTLKKLDLESLERPKTLVMVHYKGKRISIPLTQSPGNLSEFLYQKLINFESGVLHKDKKSLSKDSDKVGKSALRKISCFTAKKQQNSQIDLRLCILLSLIRISPYSFNYPSESITKNSLKRTDFCIDITKYYRFIEIQPFYCFRVQQLFPGYELYSILQATTDYNIYLGRRNSDGRFFSIKIYLMDNTLGVKQYNALKIFYEEQNNLRSMQQLEVLPEIEEVRKIEGYILLIYQFCPGGKASEYFREGEQRYFRQNQLECLDFMKQLVWGINTLHEKYNLIHREVCLENIEIDIVGNMRIVNYSNCMLCYSSNYLINTQIPQSYEGSYEMPNNIVPPQVLRSQTYNNLVDYYGIGVILYQLYYGENPNNRSNLFPYHKQKTGIEIAIENLMNQNIEDRQIFVNQVISELHEEKIQNNEKMLKYKHENIHHHNKESLPLEKIQSGLPLGRTGNKIDLEKVGRILGCEQKDKQFIVLNPMKKGKSRSKGKSKSKSVEKTKKKSSSKDSREVSKSTKGAKTKQNFDNLSKKSEKSQQKLSLNRSVDSRNNSVKQKKSTSSQSKKKNLDKPSSKILKDTGKNAPLVPTLKTTKSPLKNQKHTIPPKSTLTYKSSNRPVSPGKLVHPKNSDLLLKNKADKYTY